MANGADAMRIGINGFGRIGRNFTKALLERYPAVEIVAVNDLTSPAESAHLFKYDSTYGIFNGEVGATADSVIIDGRPVKILAERDPAKLPWKTARRRCRHRIDRYFYRCFESSRAHRRRRRKKSYHLGAR